MFLTDLYTLSPPGAQSLMFFLYSGNQVCRTGNCPTLATGSLSLAFPQLGWLQWARQLASCLPSQVWEREGKSWSAVHQRNTSDSENNLSPLFLSYFRPVVEKETCFIIAHPFQKRDRCANNRELVWLPLLCAHCTRTALSASCDLSQRVPTWPSDFTEW